MRARDQSERRATCASLELRRNIRFATRIAILVEDDSWVTGTLFAAFWPRISLAT
jgi:hypothetical protein